MHEHGSYVAQLLTTAPRAYAAGAVDRQLRRDAANASAFDELHADTVSRLSYLAEALATGHPELFGDHVVWTRVALHARGVADDLLRANLECVREELDDSLPEAARDLPNEYLTRALACLDAAPRVLARLHGARGPHVELAQTFLLAQLGNRAAEARAVVLDAVAGGVTASDVR